VAGYTRQSSADIIATAVVRANPLNVEYNALRDAFNSSSGHKHDGTAAEGAYVPLIADADALNKVAINTANNRVGVFVEVSSAAVEQIRIQDGAIVPVTNNDIDLGTSSLEFKDLYIDGTAHIDTLDVDANAGIIGNLTVSGNTILGDAANDTVTITADVASPLIPSADDTHDLGAVGSEWRNLYVDGTANIDALVADTADINGGTVDGAVIGGASAAAGTFTSLNASGTATLATVDINAGNIDGTVIGAGSAAAITGTTITGTSLVGAVTGDVTGNADTATALETARTIGGVSFNGTANINLPGVNTAGNQDTSGTAADATVLETARTIGGVSFDGSANINLPGVNAAGNQSTSGNAASATILETARTIAGNSFNGSANITIAATDLSDTDQSLATGDNVTFASVTGNLTGNVTSTGANSFGSVTVSGAATLNGNTIIGNAATDTVTVTADVASNLIPSADSSYSLGDSSNYWSHGYIDAITTTGNVIVGGDLTVNGTTTTVATTNMTVSDALIELGTGTTGTPANDAGIVIERGDAANAFMGYDESADKFTVGTGTFTGASTGNLSITTGTLVANVEGNVTGNVTGSSGSTTGNAATATALATARTIGGVSFDGTANINLPGVNASGTQDTSGNADTATALATARTIAGQSFDGTGNISIAPTDLTGVNSTATELNIMDGDTSASATTLADADRVVVNDAGTMKQVALTDFETYFEGALDTLSNVTTVGALNSGSITSGFGDINNGSSAITTTGTVTYGNLSDGTITITGFVDEDNMASNSATLIPTQQSVEARIQAVSATANNVTGLNATGTELNTVADFSAVSVDTSTAIASNDALLVFDNGNEIGYRDVDLLDTYFSATTKTLTNKTITSPILTGMHLNDSGFTVEGSSADGNETTVAFTNPTAARTITFTDASGTVAFTSDINVTNVTAAGALMDSEVTNLAQVKAFSSADYATAAQGTLATNALPKAGGVLTGAVTTNSTFDGVDIAVRDGILTTTTTTANAALPKAGGTMTGNIVMPALGTVDGRDLSVDGAKLDLIEASADVTDATNVTAAGALMDSEVTNLAQVKAFSSADYATAAQGTTADNALPKAGGALTGAVTTNSTFDGRDVATDGAKLDTIATSANNYVHPNHTGEVTSTADGATVITDNVVDEANLKVSNTPTNGYFLSAQSGNTGGLTWAEAASGADLYAENPSSPTAPSATGANAVAIGSGSNAGGTNAVALGVGSAAGDGAFCAINGGGNTSYGAVGNRSIAMGEAARAQGQDSVAIGENSLASLADSFAIGYNTDATAIRAAAFGYNAQANGSNATALTNSYASGTDSFAAAIANNTSSYGATGANSIAIGELAKASGQKSFSFGYSTQATGTYSYSLGRQAQATQEGSVAIGSFAKSAIIGKVAVGGYSPNNIGDSQAGIVNLYADTASATPEALTTNNSTASTDNQVILPDNSAFAFHGTIVARQQASGGTACAAWKVEGLIRREANAGTTVLVNSAITILDNTPAWGMTLSADTTNGGLKIEVTGEAATNIRWVATINTSEVTYA